MPKPKTATGEKNLISKRLIELREKNHMSQRMLAHQLQLRGYDMDKNVITRIETNDVEITSRFFTYLSNQNRCQHENLFSTDSYFSRMYMVWYIGIAFVDKIL